MKRFLVLVCLFAVAFACSKAPEKPVKAPYFECTGIDGKTYTLDTFKGKRLLLIFWATWCPTCKKEMARLLLHLDELKRNNIAVLAVSLDRNAEAVRKVAIERGFTGISVAIISKQMSLDYQGVRFLPTAYLIDERGYIMKKLVGELNPNEIIRAFGTYHATSSQRSGGQGT